MWYNLFLLLFALTRLPDLFRGRYPDLLARLGFQMPTSKRSTLWIHAPSVGEIQSARTLIDRLMRTLPREQFVITTTTATGLATAQSLFAGRALIALLPLDFSWNMARLVRRLKPHRFLLIESDIWPNLLCALKASGARVSLVSGKLSARSAARFARFPRFARRLFGYFDELLLQSETHLSRFTPLVPDPTRLHVTGLLKLDVLPHVLDPTFPRVPHAITLASTHAPEEALLLDRLLHLRPLILAPRHPHRIPEIIALLKSRNIPFSLSTHRNYQNEPVLLVDELNRLADCYAQSDAALVCGSFTPKIGGHNAFEPLLYNCPVLFGPHMHQQSDLAHLLLSSEAASQVTLDTLLPILKKVLDSPTSRESGKALVASTRGILNQTLANLDLVSPHLL